MAFDGAAYMKKRRIGKKNFVVLLDKDKLESFETLIQSKGKTKQSWLNEMIDEELKRNKSCPTDQSVQL